jgi:hypothetical protein
MVQPFMMWPPSPSPAVGVGHSAKVEPVALVRGADRASWQSGGPDGIAKLRQISPHSGEPFTPKRARNLFSKQVWRAPVGDEAVKDGPEMPMVGCALQFAADGEGLAWQRACPAGEVLTSGELESDGPEAEPGEPVTLLKSGDVIWANGFDWSFIDFPLLDQPALHETAQPCAQEPVAFVEVEAARGHGSTTYVDEPSGLRGPSRQCCAQYQEPSLASAGSHHVAPPLLSRLSFLRSWSWRVPGGPSSG